MCQIGGIEQRVEFNLGRPSHRHELVVGGLLCLCVAARCSVATLDLGHPLDLDHSPSSSDSSPPHSAISQSDCFYGLSSEKIYKVLDIFFRTFGGHFPFFHNKILSYHIRRSRQASKFLITSILALTARFCPEDVLAADHHSNHPQPWQKAAPFLKDAKEQLVSLLAVPAPDGVESSTSGGVFHVEKVFVNRLLGLNGTIGFFSLKIIL